MQSKQAKVSQSDDLWSQESPHVLKPDLARFARVQKPIEILKITQPFPGQFHYTNRWNEPKGVSR